MTENRGSIPDRRGAVDQQVRPTGDGAVVFTYVEQILHESIKRNSLPTGLRPHTEPANLQNLWSDLMQRAEMGKAKYGTYLRVNNNRNASVDLYQELQDALMYAAQARMENKPGGDLLELLIHLAATLAGQLNERS